MYVESKKTNEALLKYAREMRKNMTPQEGKLWHIYLKKRPEKIYRQRVIGNYIVDFYCPTAKLVIELDGSQHYEDEMRQADILRTKWLEEQGLKVIRFSNREVNEEFQGVCKKIDDVIWQRLQIRSPSGGAGTAEP